MHYLTRLVLCAAVVLAAAPLFAAVVDDFNDNATGPEWTVIEDVPATLWLTETNARLELSAASPVSSGTDALYLSNGTTGFQMLTNADFSITIDYSFTSFSGTGTLGLDLGIGRDIAGTDSAAVAFARSSTGLLDNTLGAGYRVGNVETLIPIGYVADTGTLSVVYDTSLDRLTVGNGIVSTNIDNVVQGQWLADKVWVSFGGRGSGLVLESGDAWLDNLNVTGQVERIPEPMTLALLSVGAIGLFVRRKKNAAPTYR